MGNRDGKSGQYPTGNLGIEGTGKLGKGDGKTGHRMDLQGKVFKRMDLKGSYRSTVATPDGSRARVEFLHFQTSESPCSSSRDRQVRAKRRRSGRWPNLSSFDLRNPIDIHNAHCLLASLGWADDSYDGLYRIALAAVMARRLASKNPQGYFAKIVRDGFTKFGPADKDWACAKAILRELDYC